MSNQMNVQVGLSDQEMENRMIDLYNEVHTALRTARSLGKEDLAKVLLDVAHLVAEEIF